MDITSLWNLLEDLDYIDEMREKHRKEKAQMLAEQDLVEKQQPPTVPVKRQPERRGIFSRIFRGDDR